MAHFIPLCECQRRLQTLNKKQRRVGKDTRVTSIIQVPALTPQQARQVANLVAAVRCQTTH